jgi:hypothetical protein
MTHSRTPWSLSPKSHDGPTVVLDASGVAIAQFSDPRDADLVVALVKGPSPEEIADLRDELKGAREERDDAERAARRAEDRLARVEKALEESNVEA